MLRRLAPLMRVLHRVALVVQREDTGGQGPHVDPLDPSIEHPVRARWTAAHRQGMASPTMALFREALRRPDGGTERDGVLGDLAEHHGLTADQALDRCLRWESESVGEWESAPRDTATGIAGFYDSVESWSFDLHWYNYLQGAGFGYPKSVIVADLVGKPPRPARMLDFGSGAGVTAQLFAALGFEVTLADVSAPLLGFARWRLERRGVAARYLRLPTELPEGAYDLITALDVMAHVPGEELDRTTGSLRRALRPGGLLVTDYDVRRRSRNNAWHLHEDDLPLRWAVERAGFVPVRLVDGIVWVYRAVPTHGLRWRLRTALAWLRLASPPVRALRRVRRALARAALVTFYGLVRMRGSGS